LDNTDQKNVSKTIYIVYDTSDLLRKYRGLNSFFYIENKKCFSTIIQIHVSASVISNVNNKLQSLEMQLLDCKSKLECQGDTVVS